MQKHFSTTVRWLKRLTNVPFGRVQAFPMYSSLGMSAPSLHRESTDSLIISTELLACMVYVHVSNLNKSNMY